MWSWLVIKFGDVSDELLLLLVQQWWTGPCGVKFAEGGRECWHTSSWKTHTSSDTELGMCQRLVQDLFAESEGRRARLSPLLRAMQRSSVRLAERTPARVCPSRRGWSDPRSDCYNNEW
ncbi:hypothetical protein DVH05_017129 [Phytophthora capsici]|nr:hypothetical protein DVH05_017129 [Phytophthora capsici]